jgi:hypothetical protein
VVVPATKAAVMAAIEVALEQEYVLLFCTATFRKLNEYAYTLNEVKY